MIRVSVSSLSGTGTGQFTSFQSGLEQAAGDPFFPEIIIYASWQRCLKDIQSKYILKSSIQTTSDYYYYHSLIALHPDVESFSLDDESIDISHHCGRYSTWYSSNSFT